MRQDNINIFLDTIDFISSNELLSCAVKESIKNTVIYDKEVTPPFFKDKESQIIISKNRTFEAAIKLHNEFPTKKIGVLNFASATNPGGGVTKGSSAQEEALCRCSTLYPILNTTTFMEKFYIPNRVKANPLHDDTVIYSPNVIICKSDTITPTRLKENEFVTVDVLSSAAPNLREKPTNSYNSDGNTMIKVTDDELYKIHYRRGKQIINVALINNIDILVLGAFGCGAFKNNPYVVARAYKDLLKEYKDKFDLIEFAIYCDEYNQENYTAFKRTFEEII